MTNSRNRKRKKEKKNQLISNRNNSSCCQCIEFCFGFCFWSLTGLNDVCLVEYCLKIRTNRIFNCKSLDVPLCAVINEHFQSIISSNIMKTKFMANLMKMYEITYKLTNDGEYSLDLDDQSVIQKSKIYGYERYYTVINFASD